jgi:hypothetical protein
MKTFKLKWIVFITPLVFLSCKSVHTEITILANPEIIWSVLTDASGYKAWNPVLVPIEGDLREGERLKYMMTQPDGKQSEVMARVKKMVKLKELNQSGGIPGILTFDHKWLLNPIDEGPPGSHNMRSTVEYGFGFGMPAGLNPPTAKQMKHLGIG